MGEKRTPRLVARYAEACNLPGIPEGGETVRRGLEILAAHRAAVDRPYEEIEKTLGTRWLPTGPPEDLARRGETYADRGTQHEVLITSGPRTVESVAASA